MKIHEYQAKQMFARYGVSIPRGYPAMSVAEAEASAAKLAQDTGGSVVVVKAQIHAGGRGKGGGVKVVRMTPGGTEVRDVAQKILGMQLITHQTGPEGQKVRRLYVEQGLDIARELYLGAVVDRDKRRIAFMASTEGGVEIEKVAAETPEKILTVHVDPAVGFAAFQARDLAFALGIGAKETLGKFIKLMSALYEVVVREDCSLCEVNPLVVTKGNDVVALDAKINLDDSAEFRHPEWRELEDKDEEDAVELEAKAVGLNYVSLDGNVGCLVNGAGLAMATMDIIKHFGAGHGVAPANFLDVGGGANQEQVTKAFKIILKSPKVKAIFVNIFGGIMKCDVVASGVVAAAKDLGLRVPLVVRLEGTNVELGRKILGESGLAIQAASTMADGAEKLVQAIGGAK
jgi:succinyl-CoA synthetase beta subunit